MSFSDLYANHRIVDRTCLQFYNCQMQEPHFPVAKAQNSPHRRGANPIPAFDFPAELPVSAVTMVVAVFFTILIMLIRILIVLQGVAPAVSGPAHSRCDCCRRQLPARGAAAHVGRCREARNAVEACRQRLGEALHGDARVAPWYGASGATQASVLALLA